MNEENKIILYQEDNETTCILLIKNQLVEIFGIL